MSATPSTDAAVVEFEYCEVWLGGEIGGGRKEIIEPDFCRQWESIARELAARLAKYQTRYHGAEHAQNDWDAAAETLKAFDALCK